MLTCITYLPIAGEYTLFPDALCVRLGRSRHAPRQLDDELGECAFLRLRADTAAVLVGHDVVADGEPQPRALAGGLGGEKGREQLLDGLGRYARSVVAKSDLDMVFIVILFGNNRYRQPLSTLSRRW